ncbi:MAG TPA: MarR family transcriptional regulator [Candidatus Limnocylindrales bacterium]|nr:MarR family transcriptional regulator [Candidatus Limnocylindrales bacterium]
MNRQNIDSVIRSLRRVNLQGSFFGQTVAVRFGLSESDVEALELLIDTGSATAGKLSDLMGLTTGAVTRVIDRLEQAGYVRRVPDPADRRRVIVEVVPEKVAAVEATMARVGEKGAEEIGHYSEADLAVINDFLTRMAAITRDEATALRDTPDPSSGGSEHAAPVGGLERARLLFKSGTNELLIRGAEDLADDLYRARFDGPVPQVRLRDGVVTIQYKGRFQWDWHERRADVRLNAGLPWDIEVEGGANKLQGKLSSLALRSFEHRGGVDQIRLTLGRPTGDVPIRLTGGANSIRIERPAGAALRLKLTGGAAGIQFDQQKLGATGGQTTLESSGASSATDRYAVELIGGASRITIAEIG